MNSVYPKGTCTEMCPENEIIQREREGLVHFLEFDQNVKDNRFKLVDRKRMVKEFSRSAAGQSTQSVTSLRTFDTLVRTIKYLLTDIATLPYDKWSLIYDFVVDRLRAVRQDMVIQNFTSEQTTILLEPIVRFYVYAAYRLCGEPISVYDPVINTNHLRECLKRVLCCYDDLEYDNKCTEASADCEQFQNRSQMESLYLILNLGRTEPMERVLNLETKWRNDELINICLLTSLEYWRGNYVRVCRNIRKLPDILLLAAAIKIPVIRKKALSIMSNAYNNKDLTFDSAKLVELLLYDDTEELYQECCHYNVPIIKFNILFTKQLFRDQKPELSPGKKKFVDIELMKFTIPELLLNNVRI